MEELFEDLKRFLEDHFIYYSSRIDRDRYLLTIDGKTYQLSEPNEEGAFFDESFHWDCERTTHDYYVFRFGGVWYRLKAGDENAVKLERLLWIGNAKYEDEALKVPYFLGIHGPFELLNGSGSYKEWCQKAKFLGIETLGICEKATLAGVLKFQEACKKAEVKSIIGMEIPVKIEEKDLQFTIKAFVKNEIGWLNLLEINKLVGVENGFATEKDIQNLREGLVIILDPKTVDFQDVSKLWKMFSHQFYYQLDTVVYEKEDRDEWYLKNLLKFFNSDFKPVAMCDAYYLEKEYSYIQIRLNKIAGVMNHESQNQYFKSGQEYYFELFELFSGFDSFYDTYATALGNLQEICLKCDYTIETGQRHLPKYKMTEEECKLYGDNQTMFTELVFKGVEDHLDLIDEYGVDVVGERIDREISVIIKGEVVDYFLILRDIVNWSKKNNILLGSGRGCFLPGQKVLLKDKSQKNIEDICIGDDLRTYWNEKNCVSRVFEYDCNEEIVELEFGTGIEVRCTKDHKFYTMNKGWVEADLLTESDDTVLIETTSEITEGVSCVKLSKKKYANYSGKVYDLQVENEHHSYTVNGMVVHNSAAGSLCSYLLGITNVNPLKYGLLFERFLNEGRTKGKVVKVEVLEISGDGDKIIEIETTSKVRVLRDRKEIIISASGLKEGDKLIDYEG